MRAWRDIAKLAIVAAVFGVCFAMLASVIGLASPWLGLLLMFYFMGLAKVAEPLFMFRMPRALRAVDARQVTEGIYRWLGVRGFGALLRSTPLRYLNGSVYLAGGKRSLDELSRQVESSEAIHFWASVLFTPYIAYVASRGLIAEAVLFVAVQVAFNVYPILHLRTVRARMSRVTRVVVRRTAQNLLAAATPDRSAIGGATSPSPPFASRRPNCGSDQPSQLETGDRRG